MLLSYKSTEVRSDGASLFHSPSTHRFISALNSGGDSRIAIDPRTGLNKYFCPMTPTPGLVCASSCTASPVGADGFAWASNVHDAIVGAGSALHRAQLLAEQCHVIRAGLLRYFEVVGLAEAILCPSGTDALLAATLLVTAEQPGQPGTAIIPSASETGTGVPLAAACRSFDGPGSGTPLTDRAWTVIEVPLRSDDGEPRSESEVDAAFALAAAGADGRPIIYVTHGTKTGLVAPRSPPPGVDVIVDACQARMEPAEAASYLRRGWPVVVTGSKFFGGPAFSGAVLFPRVRLPAPRRQPPSASPRHPSLGAVLRWTAALESMEVFKPLADGMADLLRDRAAVVQSAIDRNPALVRVSGLQPGGAGWGGLPSIFTFGVRDPEDRGRSLSAAELRPLYERLARRGVLLGQPVNLGSFGGLRIAVGARDLVESPCSTGLPRLFDVLGEVTASNLPGSRQDGRSTWH